MKPHGEKVYFLAYIWAVCFALLLAGGLYYAAQRDLERQAAVYRAGNRHLLDLLQEGRGKADLSAVVLGNSRLRNALAVGFDPEIPVTLPDGRRLAVVQYGIDGAGFFNFADMADDIVRLRPDYLVVMPNVLTNRRAAQPFFMNRAVTTSLYLDRLLAGQDRKAAWLRDRSYIVSQCYDSFSKTRMDDHLKRLALRDFHSLDPANGDYMKALDFLKRARDAGIAVIMLDLEPNMEMLDALGVPPVLVDYPGLGHAPSCGDLLPGLADQVKWVRYYPVEAARHYCDFMHLNDRGRTAFTAWFLALLSRDFRTAGLCPAPTGR